MRMVRVQGCLPTLAVLLVLGLLAGVAFTAGVAVLLATAGFLVLLAVINTVRRLLGRPPAGPFGGRAPGPFGGPFGRGPAGPARDQVVEALPPDWIHREPGGPVVEAGPRDPGGPTGAGQDPDAGGPPGGAGERNLPPRG